MRTWTKTEAGNYRSSNGLEIVRGFSKLENAATWTLTRNGERVLNRDRFTLRACKADAVTL